MNKKEIMIDLISKSTATNLTQSAFKELQKYLDGITFKEIKELYFIETGNFYFYSYIGVVYAIYTQNVYEFFKHKNNFTDEEILTDKYFKHNHNRITACYVKEIIDGYHIIEFTDDNFGDYENVYIGIDKDIKDREIFCLMKKIKNNTYKCKNINDKKSNLELNKFYYSTYRLLNC